MKRKFTEFFLFDERNYLASEYWDLYDKNPQAAISKFDGRMLSIL